MADWRIEVGDCRDVLRSMPAQSVHTVVTSPPYFGLRDYGTGEWEGGDSGCDHVAGMARQDTERETPGGRGGSFRGGEVQFRVVCGKCGARRVDRQIGLEPTPDEFVAALVAVFREVRRVLRDDGTVWLNLGDSYARPDGTSRESGRLAVGLRERQFGVGNAYGKAVDARGGSDEHKPSFGGAKPKDLLGVPWMVAFALRADGWYLRSDIIWSKPNPMPESVTDRPTKAHEYVFLLSKGPRYFYDADAIREPHSEVSLARAARGTGSQANGSVVHDEQATGMPAEKRGAGLANRYWERGEAGHPAGRNKRSVWTVATQPYAGAHFATFPPKLIEPCVLAGAPEGGRVLDPFAGAGTTGLVALQHGREFVGIELNPEYAQMARDRIETAVRLGFRPPQNGAKVSDDQLDIFGAAQ